MSDIDECGVHKNQDIPFDVLNLQPFQIVWIIAFICVGVATYMSLVLVWKHFQYYRKPEQQRHIIRILLMVPVYSVCSFLSLRYYHNAVYFDAVRSCYEAVVIYSFYALLLNYLGPDHASQKAALQKKPDGRYPFPFGCFWYNPRSGGFLKACTRGTLQYMLIHPITSLIQVVLESNGHLCPDSFSTSRPMFWLIGIEMISVTIAMYFLVMFYLIVHDDVGKYKPILKFISVKFVLFFSFWQSIFLAILASNNVLEETPYFTVNNVSSQIQNFLICMEMVIASSLHVWSFGHEEYEGERTLILHGLRDIITAKDLLHDTRNAMKMKRKPRNTGDIELKDTASLQNLNKEAGENQQSSQQQQMSVKQKSTKLKVSTGLKADTNIEKQALIEKVLSAEGDFGDVNAIKEMKTQDAYMYQIDDDDRLSVNTEPDMDEGDVDYEGVGIIRNYPRVHNQE
ncbi:hypothetical protein MP228_005094 [Amoeboaphelidium protococcarum]|nr:hypothetical protein MP228_005094 [Amoeboaphelidium protococcarum]